MIIYFVENMMKRSSTNFILVESESNFSESKLIASSESIEHPLFQHSDSQLRMEMSQERGLLMSS